MNDQYFIEMIEKLTSIENLLKQLLAKNTIAHPKDMIFKPSLPPMSDSPVELRIKDKPIKISRKRG